MNYLAHAYLSFNDPEILVGNMIADFIRGKQIYQFSERIQEGIRIHRQIDDFTDHHPMFIETKRLFNESAGRYNSSFLDITFDHFLALDSEVEPSEGWLLFTEHCYREIERHMPQLPDDFRRFFAYMKKENWLYNYRYKWMMKTTFERLARRAKFLDNDADIFSDFNTHYELLREGYEQFFLDLLLFTKNDLVR